MHKRYSRDGLYRRENGIWAFRYKDNHNAWREKYTGTTNRQDARAFKTQYLQQAQQGTLPNELAKLRLEEAIRYYLDQREGILGPRTWKVHHSRGRTLLQVWGNKR